MERAAVSSASAWRWGLALLIIAVLVRIPLWLQYVPVLSADTTTYETMARFIASGDFSGYEGKRPPGYPVFLLLTGGNYSAVWGVQSVLGIATVILIFLLALRRGARPVFAFAAGLATTLSVNLLLFEAGVLTEALSTFLLVLALWLWDRGINADSDSRVWRQLLAASAVVGAAALVKPFLVFMVALLPLLSVYGAKVARQTWPSSLKRGLAAAIPAFLLVLGWSAFNKSHLDYFGVTTLAGYNLTQHSGAVMEQAPEQYAVVRDIYLKYREPRVRETGSHSMTIWEAYAEMMEATGQTFPQLSETLGRLSTGLLLSHPKAYAKTAFEAWLRFWKVPLPPSFLEADGASPELLRNLTAIADVERYALVVLKGVFLLLVFVAALLAVIRRRLPDSLDVAVVATIFAASALQALTEYGENARYSIPFQGLMFFVICTALLPRRTVVR